MRPDPVGLQVRGLDWSVRGGPRILAGIELAAEPGTIVGLVGPNGSGKSSLLRCIYGAARPDAGAVLIDGVDTARLSARNLARRVAVLIQDSPADFDYTVAEMVAMGRSPHHGLLDRVGDTDRFVVQTALDTCEVADLAERTVSTLSGGERQRVLLARALAQEPGLLLLDEPTNHLDLHYQLALLDLVCSLGVTIVAALHDLTLAAAYCDQLVVLDGGQIAAAGPVQDVLTTDLLRRVYRVPVVVETGPSGRPVVRVDVAPRPLRTGELGHVPGSSVGGADTEPAGGTGSRGRAPAPKRSRQRSALSAPRPGRR